VRVKIGIAPEKVTVINVVGQDKDTAKSNLESVSLVVNLVEIDSVEQKGKVERLHRVFHISRRGTRGVNLILDTGGLIGIERDDRRVAGLVELGRRAGANLVTVAPVVAQAWRGGARQARLARWLSMIDIRITGLSEAKAAGELLAATSTRDAVDALVTLAAAPGDQLLTSDSDDLKALVNGRAIPVTVVAV
jgi:hypothetical protein